MIVAAVVAKVGGGTCAVVGRGDGRGVADEGVGFSSLHNPQPRPSSPPVAPPTAALDTLK